MTLEEAHLASPCDASPNSVTPAPYPWLSTLCFLPARSPVTYAMMDVAHDARRPSTRQGGEGVDFVAVVDQVIALLRQRGRLTYRTLKRQFQLDDAALEDLKNELIEGQRLAVDERGDVLVWTGETGRHGVPSRCPVH